MKQVFIKWTEDRRPETEVALILKFTISYDLFKSLLVRKRIYTFIILLFVGLLVSCKQNSGESTESIVIKPQDLIGKTIEYRYGESIYHVTIDSDSTLHWEAMAGDEKGTRENETYVIASIDDSKLLITWGEANGIGVAQVLDFKKGLVYNHLLRGRAVTAGEGEIKILDGK
jgi:hypothetical protein